MPIAASTRRRSAFTLIELLVVIAIIAILAAILFPVFAQAREKARQSACLSNLKQVALAFRMYVQDYDETYMYSLQNKPGPSDETYGWQQRLVPYVKNGDVFVCPSSVLAGDEIYKVPLRGSGGTIVRYGFSYKPNRHIMFQRSDEIVPGLSGGFVNGPIPSDADITKPANTMVFLDTPYSEWEALPGDIRRGGPGFAMQISEWATVDAAGVSQRAATPCQQGTGTGRCTVATPFFTMHNRMVNVAFCDGHVKAIKPQTMIGPRGAATVDTQLWGCDVTPYTNRFCNLAVYQQRLDEAHPDMR